jgi:predicted O-methyltransferase YrrM
MDEIDAIREDMKAGRVRDGRLAQVLRHAAQPDHWESRYDFFHHLVRLRQPRLCVEMGCYKGVTSAYMCSAAEAHGGHVVCIDVQDHYAPVHLMPGLFKNFHFIRRDTRAAVEKVAELVEEHGPVGVVWQDSSHTWECCNAEWRLYRPLLEAGAVWCVDDITSPQGNQPPPNIWNYWLSLPEPKRVYSGGPFRNGGVMGVCIVGGPDADD